MPNVGELNHIINQSETLCSIYRRLSHLVVYKCCEGKVVKQICEVLPHIRIAIFPKTFVVKTIYLGDLSTFVIAS